MSRPNCQRLMVERHRTEEIHSFLTFLSEKGIHLTMDDPVKPDDWRYQIRIGCDGPKLDALLYEYIGVDPVELENERQSILDELQG